MSRAETLRELVEDFNDFQKQEDTRRNVKKERHRQSLQELQEQKGKDKRRTGWNIQRAIRRGEFPLGIREDENTDDEESSSTKRTYRE